MYLGVVHMDSVLLSHPVYWRKAEVHSDEVNFPSSNASENQDPSPGSQDTEPTLLPS